MNVNYYINKMKHRDKKLEVFYKLLQLSGTTTSKITGYIAMHIDPLTKKYRIHRKFLASKFNCSIRTVNNALKVFKKSKNYKVTHKYVFIEYHDRQTNIAVKSLLNLKRGESNAND